MKFVGTTQRYLHTLRYLKPVQFYGRLWFRLHRPRLDKAVAPRLRVSQEGWQASAARSISMPERESFCFLNQRHSLPAQGGWNDAALEKLWLYNLHYFDDLNAERAAERVVWHRSLMQRWVAENPPVSGNGWEPYPTSLRIVNWVKWALAGNELPEGCAPSLMLQARWLARRLEWHLLGNHLFANAKALVFAGLFFEGPEAASWLATGLKIIARELPEQVLADGGNFERSPMYHAIFLEDVLDLVNAVGHWRGLVPAAQVGSWREAAGRMLNWLQGMTHPDGQIALFNDAAFGIASDLAALRAYAQRLGVGHGSPRRCAPRDDESAVIASEARPSMPAFLHFSESGYIRLESNTAVALLDVAPVGPDYLPGHAHADTLSFELSVFGQRVVVNGGTSCYGLGPQRLCERETAAHSTVQVAGQSSSEVWAGFRVARRAHPFDVQVQDEPEFLKVACSHDGYTRLPDHPVHRREWEMRAGSLRVSDVVIGGTHPAVARYILHPTVRVAAIGKGAWQLTLPSGQSLRFAVLAGRARVEPARYAPEFGKVLATQCLALELVEGQARTEWIWS